MDEVMCVPKVVEYEMSRRLKEKQLSVQVYLYEIHLYTKFEKLKPKNKRKTHT